MMKGIMATEHYKNGMPTDASIKKKRLGQETAEEKNAHNIQRMYERNEDEKRMFEI